MSYDPSQHFHLTKARLRKISADPDKHLPLTVEIMYGKYKGSYMMLERINTFTGKVVVSHPEMKRKLTMTYQQVRELQAVEDPLLLLLKVTEEQKVTKPLILKDIAGKDFDLHDNVIVQTKDQLFEGVVSEIGKHDITVTVDREQCKQYASWSKSGYSAKGQVEIKLNKQSIQHRIYKV